jgi:hypothetical protein
MAFLAAHRQVAFWAASCLIAFSLSFVLGAVWRSHQAPPNAAIAYADD